MAKRVKQFIYSPSNSNSSTLSYKTLTSGEAFRDCPSIIQLGIQSLPGTKFFVNGNYNPVIVGSSGIYELDLDGLAEITKLYFSGQSIVDIENSSMDLIIDILFESEE